MRWLLDTMCALCRFCYVRLSPTTRTCVRVNVRLMLPAQPVGATPSTALIRQCLRGRTICLGVLGQKPSQGSVPAGLTLTSDFGFCFQCQAGSSFVLRRPIEITAFTRWDEKAGLHGMRYAPNVRRARSTKTETGNEKD